MVTATVASLSAVAAEARAAFQKTASDMEHERSNLMCVINQASGRAGAGSGGVRA